ncbi:MAG: fumarylacetoacetate hydrolase family protein [Pikeienuella sp.]
MTLVFEAAPIPTVAVHGSDERIPVRRIFCIGRNYAAHAREMGKGFDRSAPVGPIYPVSAVGHPSTGAIKLTVNGQTKQEADLADLIWSIPEMISILSHSMELKAGDLIMTGTPAGVGPLVEGDTCVVSIEGLGDLTTHIGPKE